MTSPDVHPPHPGTRRRHLLVLLAGVALALFVGANAHLVYVSFASQPECVPHLKTPGGEGTFRAARSAC